MGLIKTSARLSLLAAALVGMALIPARATCQQDAPDDFDATLARIEKTRSDLARRYAIARTPKVKRAVRAEARVFVVRALTGDIFPAWLGTPWHMGQDDDAAVPHEKGKRVSCSYFVTAALQNVGLALDDRRRWAESAALHIQRSLAPRVADLHRYFSIPPAELAERLARLPKGLYVIGLNCHVGFVRVAADGVWFIHSDYVEPDVGVRIEPLAESAAIASSQSTGYWVTPVFQDDRLIEYWLTGRPVAIQRLGMIAAQERAGGANPQSTKLLFLE